MRNTFDFFTNYGENKMTYKKYLFRFVFLETLAGVYNILLEVMIVSLFLNFCIIFIGMS